MIWLAAAPAAKQGGGSPTFFLILLVLLAISIWLIVRTGRRRALQRATLERPVGDAVTRTAGGLVGAKAGRADQQPTDSPVSLTLGSRIASYRLEELVGRGGMAVVYRARDERLARQVAVKVLTPPLADDEEFRKRFARESRAAAALDDPHIIPVFEAGQANGALFLAMRYVSGGDVLTLLRRDGPLPAARAAAIISPIAAALDAAHAVGLVHRDVKPANLLIDARPRRPDHVYLSDFGLSKSFLSSAALTSAGQFLGTLDYVSPEQIEGKPVDGRTDQYALACTGYELLAGLPPFHHDDITAVMHAQLTQPPPPLSARRPDLPPAIDHVFVTALSKAPQDRYATCADFADALRAATGLPAYEAHGATSQQAHPPTQIA